MGKVNRNSPSAVLSIRVNLNLNPSASILAQAWCSANMGSQRLPATQKEVVKTFKSQVWYLGFDKIVDCKSFWQSNADNSFDSFKEFHLAVLGIVEVLLAQTLKKQEEGA